MSKHVVPKNKKELIEQLNTSEIADIVCVSTHDGRYADENLFFGIEIITKDGKKFSITQDIRLKPHFDLIEVTDWSTGDGYPVPAQLGKTFEPKKYKYWQSV